jgi:hypothetical protein
MNNKKIDYVVIASDDNPTYKDFYPLVAKKWLELGFKTYFVNITNEDSVYENKWGIVHNLKALENFPTGYQSQIVRLFTSKFINGNLLMSDIDMLPLNGDYFNQYNHELTDDNVILYSGQPYDVNKFYPMCYVLSKSHTFIKLLDLQDLNFEGYCTLLSEKYGLAWNSDENFMFDKFENHKDKLIIKKDRDFSKRIDRGKWIYDPNLLKDGHYIDSHLLRPYDKYFKEVNELLKHSK